MNHQLTASDYSNIIYPFHGKLDANERILNTEIQSFANQVTILASLNTGGKISSKKTFKRIKKQYKKLKRMRRFLSNEAE